MKILYAAAEIAPFARMTHTADLLRFLPASLQDKGYEIRILLPKYGLINGTAPVMIAISKPKRRPPSAATKVIIAT